MEGPVERLKNIFPVLTCQCALLYFLKKRYRKPLYINKRNFVLWLVPFFEIVVFAPPLL